MALSYPYRLVRPPQPVFTLGGRWVRPRPLSPITVIGPADTRVLNGHLDTGSDDTVLAASTAALLGIDLGNAPVGHASGVGQAPVPLKYAEVTFRLAKGGEQREWRAWVGFTSVPLTYALLGFAGFLQFFTATFYGDREEVELAVNSLYPGT